MWNKLQSATSTRDRLLFIAYIFTLLCFTVLISAVYRTPSSSGPTQIMVTHGSHVSSRVPTAPDAPVVPAPVVPTPIAPVSNAPLAVVPSNPTTTNNNNDNNPTTNAPLQLADIYPWPGETNDHLMLSKFATSRMMLDDLGDLRQRLPSREWMHTFHTAPHEPTRRLMDSLIRPLHDPAIPAYAIAYMITPIHSLCRMVTVHWRRYLMLHPTRPYDFIIGHPDSMDMDTFRSLAFCKQLWDKAQEPRPQPASPNHPPIGKMLFLSFEDLEPLLQKQTWLGIADPGWRKAASKIAMLGFEQYEKILMMDIDSVVLQPLGRLFQYDYHMLFAPDTGGTDCRHYREANAGTLVVRPSRRLHKMARQYFEAKEVPVCGSDRLWKSEQEALNCMCGFGGGPRQRPEIQCGMMPPTYVASNWMMKLCEEFIAAEPFILHLLTGEKPWLSKEQRPAFEAVGISEGTNEKPMSWFRDESRKHCYAPSDAWRTFFWCIDDQQGVDAPAKDCAFVVLR